MAITEFKDIEVAASHAFTAANFYMLQDDLKSMGRLEVAEVNVGLGSHDYTVVWRHKREFNFLVQFSPGNLDETLRCSCGRLSRKGLPCKHILYVLNVLKVREIPSCCVL